MMNKRIRSLIDEIFQEMKMTAENLALRDELLANAQARYEDMMAQGKSEEEAFVEVAASLEDVYGLLEEMKSMDAQEKTGQREEEIPVLKTGTEKEEPKEAPKEDDQEDSGEEAKAAPQTDLGDALGKAFTALGDFSQAIMPEAKKLYNQMDDVTGGMLGKLGRVARKGMLDAQKAAGEAIDKLAGDSGEIVFDFGANREAKKPQEQSEGEAPQDESGFAAVVEEKLAAREKQTQGGEIVMDLEKEEVPQRDDAAQQAAVLRAQAEELRAQAGLKDLTGDSENAAALRAQADALDTQADALEQTQALEEAIADAEAAAQEAAEPIVDADGDVNEDALAKAVEQMARDAEDVIQKAAQSAEKVVHEAADYIVRDASEPVFGGRNFPAAGLHRIDIQLDADDVEIMPADGAEVETVWEARSADSEPVVTLSGHTLSIRRRNPDVFKTFFSVFQKAGGRITVRVPRGYAAQYAIHTTSGDVHLSGVDVDDVKVNTTSGSVRVEPDAQVRAQDIAVTTVSGHATVSACADTVEVTTVSGGQFISCDAHKVDVNVVSGKVHVEGACEEWEVSAVQSDVDLLCTVAPTKKVQISSVHGDVRLALPGDIRGFVAESTGALGCEIINEFGANRYGTCGLPIRMETMRGKLLITRL